MDRIESLAKSPDIDDLIQPLEIALADLPRCTVTAEGAAKLCNGNPAPVTSSEGDFGDVVWAAHQGRAVAIGIYRSGEISPSRVFHQ